MRKTKLTVKPTAAFRKDYKLAIKRVLVLTLSRTGTHSDLFGK